MVAHGDIRRPVDALPPVSFSVSAWTQRQAAHVSAGEQRAVQSTTSICMQPAAHRVCVHFCGFHSKPDFHPLLTGLPISTLVANITARTGAAAHSTPPARTSPLGRAALAGYLCRSVRARAGGGQTRRQRSAAQPSSVQASARRIEENRSFTHGAGSRRLDKPLNLGTAVLCTARIRERGHAMHGAPAGPRATRAALNPRRPRDVRGAHSPTVLQDLIRAAPAVVLRTPGSTRTREGAV